MDHKMKLIDYLYGEMNQDERATFEQQLAGNEELRDELASLQAARKFARMDQDVAPAGLVHILPRSQAPARTWNLKWLAWAASFLVLLVAGKLLDVRVVAQEGQFAIQYGEISSPPPVEDVRTIVQDELKREHEYLQTQLASFSERLDDQFQSQPNKDENYRELETQLAVYTKQITSLKTELRNDQAERHNSLLERLHQNQRDHSTELMQGMVRYVENQRRQDLELINQGFNNLSMAVQLGENYTQFVNQPLQKF